MPRTVISYRRDDTRPVVWRMRDYLVRALGAENVFLDEEDIPLGVDWRQHLEARIQSAEALLVIIGKRWAGEQTGFLARVRHRTRLDNPHDPVRYEVEMALQRPDLTVIPVFIDTTPVPAVSDLPEAMRRLRDLNGTRIDSGRHFSADMEFLVTQLLALDDTRRDERIVLTVAPQSAVWQQPAATALQVTRPALAAPVVQVGGGADWLQVQLPDGQQGWVQRQDVLLVQTISLGRGFGARTDRWQVLFTAPDDNPTLDRTTFTSIDTHLADTLRGLNHSLDIAAFQFDHPLLIQEVLAAHQRGVRVRLITDDEHGLENEWQSIQQFAEFGIPLIADARAALMHHKFMILDGRAVWTGSWNFTLRDTYRNNNNALMLYDDATVIRYRAEFDALFQRQEFDPRWPASSPLPDPDAAMRVYFAPKEEVESQLLAAVAQAQQSVRFMAFTMTIDALGDLLVDLKQRGVEITGILETRGSEHSVSQAGQLRAAGIDARQDGNRYTLHHKVMVIDEETVITGSLNFSHSSLQSNNDNVLIIRDRLLAQQYLAEFQRRWAEALVFPA